MPNYPDMNSNPKTGLTVVLAAIAALLFQTNDAHADEARSRISPGAISAHLRFLADDLLEGRETGSRGYDIAARYVAAQFAAAGLEPASDDGSFFQQVAFKSARLIRERSTMAIDDDPQPLLAGRDHQLRPSLVDPTVDLRAPVVFAGFGVVAPELDRDDYAALDVKGAIVLLVTGAPPSFSNTQRAYYSGTRVKEEIAAARGAVGVLYLKSLTDERRRPFARAASEPEMTVMRRLDSSGTPAEVNHGIRAAGGISIDVARGLFKHAPQPVERVLADAEQGISAHFPLGVSVSIHTETEHGSARSANVLARLPGSDPSLRNQHVVLSAHLDHLGNHGPADDPIYNGALDNASGVACLLEIARTSAALPRAPRRSILFAVLTGEEKGEQGSAHLAEHPPARVELVADVNMDMFLMIHPVADLVMFGGEHSSLGPLTERIVRATGFGLSPDPAPEEVRFVRSDQYSFVRQGIPAVTLKAGSKSSDPSIDGGKRSTDWLRTIYHSPKDDLSQTFDYPSAARYARTNMLLVLAIANSRKPPAWNRGDFFGNRFPEPRRGK